MRRGVRITIIGLLIAAAGALAASAAWTADFTPSTWNPAVGDVVQFSVCESCHGSVGAHAYLWDFNSDGVTDLETSSPTASFVCSSEGFYAVKLTVRDAGGREETRTKGIFAGTIAAYGVREIIMESDGAALVTITVMMNAVASGVGLLEGIPSGWQIEVIDAAGSITNNNSAERRLEIVWASQLIAGDQFIFVYRLYSNYASQVRLLSGEVSGFVNGSRFAGQVCGELFVP